VLQQVSGDEPAIEVLVNRVNGKHHYSYRLEPRSPLAKSVILTVSGDTGHPHSNGGHSHCIVCADIAAAARTRTKMEVAMILFNIVRGRRGESSLIYRALGFHIHEE
jgi:hypothetical protein